ncbi:MAG: thioredoxin family protein [Bacteroidota bacterium]
MKKLMFLSAVILLLSSFKPEAGYKVGDKAIDFSLKNVDDKMMSLADLKDAKGYIIVFTCNHCPFSIKYEDRINALDKKYKKLGYPVVAINPNDASQHGSDDFEGMKTRAKEKKFSFPYLHDESQAIATAYGAARTPHVYIVERGAAGNTVKYIGAIDDNSDNAKQVKEKYVENAVDALLAGKAVSPDFTKAIGCTIKWKK